MLVLTRKMGETIWIGPDICITITDVDRGSVKLGIDAPRELLVLRGELKGKKHAYDKPADQATGAAATDAE